MNITLTAKVQIIVNNEDSATLKETLDAYKDACNEVSDFVYSSKILRPYSLQSSLYHKLRADYGLKSQMAQSVMKTVTAKYKTVKSLGHPWNKITFSKPQIDLVWNRDYSLKGDTLSVNTLQGRRKFKFHIGGMERYFSSECKFGTAKLVFKKSKWYLHISATLECDDSNISDTVNIVGIDRGINFLACAYSSDGKTSFASGKTVKQKRAHYKSLRKELQQVGTPSSRRRLKAIGNRENRYINDVNHCISKALVSENPEHTLFVLEDLSNIRNSTEKVRIKDRYVSVSWPFYDLEQKLMYKAAMHSDIVIKVNPAYTSQTCPICGCVHKQSRDKKKHIYKCQSCGYTSNDDRIAAMNLHHMGIEYLKGAVTV